MEALRRRLTGCIAVIFASASLSFGFRGKLDTLDGD